MSPPPGGFRCGSIPLLGSAELGGDGAPLGRRFCANSGRFGDGGENFEYGGGRILRDGAGVELAARDNRHNRGQFGEKTPRGGDRQGGGR